MVHVECTAWGVGLRIVGVPTRQEFSKLLDELRKALPTVRPFFGAILDMSAAGAIHPEHRDLLLQMLRFLQSRGLVRLAAGVPTGLAASQIRRLSSEAGVLPALRCLDTQVEAWKLQAERWAVSGHEPEGGMEPHPAAPEPG